MKLETIEGTTYIRGDNGRTFATYDPVELVIQIARNGDVVRIPLLELLDGKSVVDAKVLQKLDDSK